MEEEIEVVRVAVEGVAALVGRIKDGQGGGGVRGGPGEGRVNGIGGGGEG